MTPQDHNKVIGIMHLIWGGFNALIMLFLIPFIIALLGPMGSDPTPPAELKTVFGIFATFIITITLLFSIPPLLAGYAMLKRKRWARVMGIIAACFEVLSMPFGTALGVYTMWFLFGQGEKFHRGDEANAQQDWRGSLRDGSAYDWETQRTSQSSRPREYTPPHQPPDWRG
ncbi:MAG: hypothetical protein QOH49_2946 [Acidobacteriota bacterium]|jgi:hypothetical protein|nr:hypothetical protein [Acidobacteriota bacterium]